MKINKETLKVLWYEDKDGNKLIDSCDFDNSEPENAEYFASRFPCELHEKHYKSIKQSDVDKCNHPRKYIVPTYGWIDGIVGRECKVCHGTQTKKKGIFHRWGKKWNGGSSKEIIACITTYSEDLVLAMANSKDFTLSEAIIVSTTACERCINVLRNKYGLDGYEEYSEEWKKANTSCEFCEESEDK